MSRIQIICENGTANQETTNSVLELVKGRIRAIDKELQALQADTDQFSTKYNLSNEHFLARFELGEMEDDEDFFVWQASIKLIKDLNTEKMMFRGIL